MTEEPVEKNIETELAEYKDKYLRLLAETENMRKRLQKEKQEMIVYAIESTIVEFLPVLENFESALMFAQKSSPEVQKWAVGFQLLLSQFREILHSHNIISYHSKGNLFDPNYHEAIEIVETNDVPDGTILEEFSKGYTCNGRVIRAARVKIAKKIVKDIGSLEKKEEEPKEEKHESEEKK